MDGTPSKSTEMLFGIQSKTRDAERGGELGNEGQLSAGTWPCPQPRGRVDARVEGEGAWEAPGQQCGRCRRNDFYV